MLLLKNKDTYTVAFYNLENLFDTENNPNTLDDDYTPLGKYHWNIERYHEKTQKLSRVIALLGTVESAYSPVLVGVVEVENDTVLDALIHSEALNDLDYGYVHHNSPDKRGLDVALLYKKKFFKLLFDKTFPLLVESADGKRDYTRDILYVKGSLKGELTHIIVNHWPSRRKGAKITEGERIKAAELVCSITSVILQENADAKIIIMGDFNDNPTSKSIKKILVGDQFYNAMAHLETLGKGTTEHHHKWNLFDQIIFSKNYLNKKNGALAFKHAEIFDPHFSTVYKGKLKGSPFRTYINRWYQGGFSDHFPVYVYLQKYKA